MRCLPSLFTLTVLLVASGSASAQGPLVEVWAQRHTTESGDFSVYDAASHAGRVTVTGWSLNAANTEDPYTVQFAEDGSVAWARHTPVAGSATAFLVAMGDGGRTYVAGTASGGLFVLCYDAAGTLLWSTTYDSGGRTDQPKELALGPAGRVYAVAESDGASDDYLTVAFSAEGDVLWSDLYDGSGGEDDTPTDIAVDDAGRVFVTGHSDRASGGLYESATVAYAPDGARRWTHRYAGPRPSAWSSLAGSLVPDGEGGVFLAGFAFSQEAHELLVMRYGSAGDLAWVATYPGPTQLNTSARSLHRGPDGNLVVIGVSQTGGNEADLLLLGYGPDGTPLWEARHEDPPFYPIDLADTKVGPDGTIYIAGWGAGAADGLDFVVARYGPTGSYEAQATSGWSGPGPSPCNELPRNGGLDVFGDLYVGGRSTCGELFDQNAGAYAARFATPSTSAEPDPLPSTPVLRAYPNPFATAARIAVVPPATGPMTVEVLDVLGRRVALLHDGTAVEGAEVDVALDGRSLPSGAYLVRASGRDWSSAKLVMRAR